jgi:hypothetical protein
MALDKPELSYGNESWTIKTVERRAAEIHFLRTSGYTLLGHKRNSKNIRIYRICKK